MAGDNLRLQGYRNTVLEKPDSQSANELPSPLFEGVHLDDIPCFLNPLTDNLSVKAVG